MSITFQNLYGEGSADALMELVTVKVSIDDPIKFTKTTVTCVNETASESTKSIEITKDNLTCSFKVPVGEYYHIEYGDIEGYSKPSQTQSKMANPKTPTTYKATYYYFTATINVTYPQGATLTCTLGDTVYTADTTTGTYAFKVHEKGTWTVKASNGKDSDSKQVGISSNGQTANVVLTFIKIYGIKRDITSSSPLWTRTDDAVGMRVRASVGTYAGFSDFDNAMPWKGIKRETRPTKDVMVKIPKFYFKRYREGNTEFIKIADGPAEGFALHPAFNHANIKKDFVYIGAFKSTENNKSVSGVRPYTQWTRDTARNGAKGKGAGWGIVDIAALSAIQMLILVEFATNSSRDAIGEGGKNGWVAWDTGVCDQVPNLTGEPTGNFSGNGSGDNGRPVVWRGLEDLWGSESEWCDGLNFRNREIYVCNNPSKYTDTSMTGYTKLSYKTPDDIDFGFITQEGWQAGENSHVMIPTAFNGSESTYYCAFGYLSMPSSDISTLVYDAGDPNDGRAGLFGCKCAFTYDKGAYRLLYIPQ